MDTKVTIVFNRRKNATERIVKNPSRGSVEIQISQGRKRKWIATDVRVYLDQWKDGFVVNHIDAQDYNIKIHNLYEKALKEYQSLDSNVSLMFHKSFCDWMEQQIEERTDIVPSTLRAHRRTVEYLRESGYIKRFMDLTERNVTLWDQWLKRKLNKQSAVHGYHKRLKVYISRAMHLGLLKESPYRFVKVPRGKSDEIKYITVEERTRVENLQLSGSMEIVRDMFIFSCYTGLAYCDLIRVKDCLVEEDGEMVIDGSRLKTSVRYKLKILPKAMEILSKYDFDLDRMSNKKCNIYLKAIQTIAGIKTKLTMHVGRHSFATWALKMGVPLAVVSKMLAHTDITTTMIYAKVLQTEVAAGFDKLKGS